MLFCATIASSLSLALHTLRGESQLVCRKILFGIALIAVLFLAALHPALAATSDIATTATAVIPTVIDSTNANAGEASGLFFGLFIGVMLTAALYLFFIWIVIHDRGQVFLMLLLLCLAINMASTNDQLMEMMGLHSQVMQNLLQNYSMIMSYILSIFFTYYFLEIEAEAPDLRMPLFVLAGLLLLLLIFAALDQRLVHFALPTLGTLTMACILVAGMIAMWRGVSGSLTHSLAFTFFLFGGLAGPLYDLGYIDLPQTSNNLAYSSFSLAAMVFAIVIAGQFATRQEEKERALAISNERFALAARGSNEGLFDWNLRSGEAFFSDQFKKIVGLPLDNSLDGLKNWTRLILPADRVTVFRALHEFRKNPKASTINFEYRVNSQKDGWRWLHTKAVATRDILSGNVLRFVGSTGDITSRKRGESALRASETRFRSITEAHPVPVLIVRLQDNQVLYSSPGAEALLELPQGTLIKHRLDRFIRKEEERQELIAAMAGNHEVNLKETIITRGDGNVLPVALSARRINYQNEAAMVLGLYDLTERKQAEAQIAKQQEALQQSEKMAALGGLLAGVAHELNNPLSVVVGQATLLIEGTNEPKVIGRAEKIYKAADRCSRIVKSFLALARRKPPERKSYDLNSIINASLELLSYQMKSENIEFKLELQSGLPNVFGDGDQLTQVFTNLALNSAQAMRDWKGKHQLTIYTSLQNANELLVTVIDTGPGIPAEIRSRVFEPFFTTKGSSGGTGVGLALCLNIIESHGGQMRLEDTPGGGATFLITLPSATAADNASIESAPARAELPPHLKILLVDDEIELAQTLADLLEPEGHDIDIAANGAIALDKLRKKNYDIIISDLRMPVLDGPGMYTELSKSMPSYLKRIIYVTGDTLSTHVQSFLSQTPVPVIEKPYRLADVRSTVANLLKEDAGKRMMGSADSNSSAPV